MNELWKPIVIFGPMLVSVLVWIRSKDGQLDPFDQAHWILFRTKAALLIAWPAVKVMARFIADNYAPKVEQVRERALRGEA